MNKVKLWVSVGVLSVVNLAVFVPAGGAATTPVCNVQENSFRAFSPMSPAMRVGNDKSRGLENAAARSRALDPCITGGGGGGEDT